MAQATTNLGAFLAARRARVRPEDVGLPDWGRRRVPGLRREELAQLAGVSVDYYVRLEQGRATHPSLEVLEAIARALQLDDLERRHLHDLATPPQARRRRTQRSTRARPALQWLLDGMPATPAMVVNRRLDFLAWNAVGSMLMGGLEQRPERERNSARFVFLDRDARDTYVEWETVARDTVGALRWAAGRDPEDEELAALVGELSVKSAEFAHWWASAEVHEKTHGRKRYAHPVVGELDLWFETFEVPGEEDLMVLTYAAEPGTPSATALKLLTQLAADEAEVSAGDATRAR